jgi:hypothetical protein
MERCVRPACIESAASLALIAVALVGCPARPDEAPLGYEADELSCRDGFDNDLDGLIDCMDPDCKYMSSLCGERVPLIPDVGPENKPQECHDFIDNDDDGLFDCGDRSCSNVPETCCRVEFTNAACSDGKDNDSNGYTDCGDYACKSGFVAVCRSEARCSYDAKTGFAVALTTCCKDGKDNDGDGKTDCDDRDCAADCPKEPEDTAAKCKDGKDNDGNGYVDCDDFSCSKHKDPAIAALCVKTGVAEDTLAKCSNGIDDDKNGYLDCADYSCAKSPDSDIAAYCEARLENTFAKCKDGKDNDGNGYVDCEDRSCQPAFLDCTDSGCTYASTSNFEAARACQESLGLTVGERDVLCSDGKDNDGDGFTDCADFDCSWNPSVTVCDKQPKVCGGLWR